MYGNPYTQNDLICQILFCFRLISSSIHGRFFCFHFLFPSKRGIVPKCMRNLFFLKNDNSYIQLHPLNHPFALEFVIFNILIY